MLLLHPQHPLPRRAFLRRSGRLAAALFMGGGIVSRWAPVAAARGGRRRGGSAPAPLFAFVGCDTTKERQGHGTGLSVYRVDFGAWTFVQNVADLVNPAALALDGQRRYLYVGQGDTGTVAAFAVDPETGRLSRPTQQACGGQNPTHLAVDPSDRYLVVLNADPGGVAILPLQPDGSLAPPREMVSLPGASDGSPAAGAGSQPRQLLFDPSGQYLLVPDPGRDSLFLFRFDPGSATLLARDPLRAPLRPGARPCRVAFHPSRPYGYVANAGDSTITTCRYDEESGTLAPLQVVSTLPPTFTGMNTVGDIVASPWGSYIYASNCGHDSIGIFAVDPAIGLLAPVAWPTSQGQMPRALGLDPSGAWLYAANEGSDSIVTFRADPAAGTLTPTGQVVQVGSPVDILFRERDIRLGRGAPEPGFRGVRRRVR